MPKKGSELLLEAWKRGPGLDEAVVKGIVQATRELDIHDVLIKGQPKPDFLRATATADGEERCGNVVRDLLSVLKKTGGGYPTIRVFPKGIPWPEQYIVDIQIGQQQGV